MATPPKYSPLGTRTSSTPPTSMGNRPMTYEEFVAANGGGIRSLVSQQQAQRAKSPYQELLQKAGEKEGKKIIEQQFPDLFGGSSSSAASTGSGLMSGGAGGAVVADSALGTTVPVTLADGTVISVAPEVASSMSSSGIGMMSGGAGANGLPAVATTAEAPGMASLSGIGSAGNVILPAAGALGAYDLFKNQRTGGRGALQGAASGAAMGAYFGPMGALIGGGIGLGAGLLNRFGDKDMWKTEGNRLRKLQEQGYDVSQGSEAMGLKMGRTKEQLIALEREKAARGMHSNEKFAGSRNEGDLTGTDLQGYAQIIERAGKGASLQDRIALGDRLLKEGKIREHHGTIDILGDAPGAAPAPAPAVNKPYQSPTGSVMIPRSKTASPGIGKDGKRITYGSKK